MDKVKKKLLEDFKRSNKARKITLAKRYGFKTPKEYLEYLEDIASTHPFTSERVEEKEVLTDIVIAFDTTGSMSGYISAVRKHVKELIPELFKNTKNLKISIVAFGDYCDMETNTEFGKAYQVINLTDNPSKLIAFVANAKTTNGGDGDEFYELVLRKIRLETSWRDGSNKSILLIADATPHPTGYSYANRIQNNTIDWKEEAILNGSFGIKVDTLACGESRWYKELSEITNGVHLRFQSASKTQDLLDGYVYTRSGSTAMFAKSMERVEKSGDAELIGVYKQLKTL